MGKTMRLDFSQRIMNAAGMLGFAPDGHALNDLAGFDAFVSNPISVIARRTARNRQSVSFAGGVVLHSGLPNPGIISSIKRFGGKWARAKLPIIVNLFGEDGDGISKAVQQIEEIENVMAIELNFEESSSLDLALELCRAALGELPLIAKISIERALEIGPYLVEAGAEVISLGPARGSAINEEGEIISGRLYGPSTFARALFVSGELARMGLSVIAGGGIYQAEEGQAMLDAGAIAIQLDTVLWNSNWKAEDWIFH